LSVAELMRLSPGEMARIGRELKKWLISFF
jgi:hypothetical protein